MILLLNLHGAFKLKEKHPAPQKKTSSSSNKDMTKRHSVIVRQKLQTYRQLTYNVYEKQRM